LVKVTFKDDPMLAFLITISPASFFSGKLTVSGAAGAGVSAFLWFILRLL
jgi:hypothetical protein